MVLATRLISLGTILCASVGLGCLAKPTNVSDEVMLDAYYLQLVTEGTNCLLISNKDQVINKSELLMQAPCYFARENNSDLLQFSYPDKNLESVALIIGNTVSAEKRKKWNLPEALICGEKRQSIYLSKGNLTVSTSTLDGGVACRDSGVDEKDFSYFAKEFVK